MRRKPTPSGELRQRAEQALGPRPAQQSYVEYEIALLQKEIQFRREELAVSQDELEHARAKFRYLYEHTPLGFATLDATGVIVDVNQKLCEALGVDRGGLYGAPFATLLDTEDADALRRVLQAAAEGVLAELEVDLCRADGTPWPVLLELVHTDDDDGWRIAVTRRT